METNDNDQLNKVNYQLKKEYKSIKKIIKEDEFILIYADDESSGKYLKIKLMIIEALNSMQKLTNHTLSKYYPKI